MQAEELAQWRQAGELARDALQYGRPLICEGADVLATVEKIETYVRRNGGGLAFPVNIATDEEAAHWTPSSRTSRRFSTGALVKLDVGVEIGGYIGDNALTIEIAASRHDEMRDAAREALINDLAQHGVPSVKLYVTEEDSAEPGAADTTQHDVFRIRCEHIAEDLARVEMKS